MADALVPLYSTTLASAASSVSIAGIPATYRDLRLVITATTSVESDAAMRFNGDTSSSCPAVRMMGSGSTATSNSYSDTQIYLNMASLLNTQFLQCDIMDYSATDKHKTTLHRVTNPAAYVQAQTARWPSLSAITSISIASTAGNFTAGSTFSLFGITS